MSIHGIIITICTPFISLSFEGYSCDKICFLISSDPRDINPLFDTKEFRSPKFQRVYQYLKLSKEGKNMDNFTFVPGNIDDDQTKCLSLMLRSVKRFSLFFSYLFFIYLTLRRLM